MGKKILIRVDASKNIGTGHVMRCLTLANEAKRHGWTTCIVLRDPDTNIVAYLSSLGHDVKELVSSNYSKGNSGNTLEHGDWLTVSQTQDAHETADIVRDFKPDWLVVDHYAIDSTWLSIIEKYGAKILVIDDLGDRDLICDLLLDQNLGASAAKYIGKVSRNCRLLLGPDFALIRDEFKEWREKSLKDRFDRDVKNILITMGGVDANNYTLKVLRELTKSKYATDCVMTTILGGSYPHKKALYEFLGSSALNVSIISDVKNMAEIMSSADICIGAAGSTSWERCCLGLPTLTFAIADNQIPILDELVKHACTIASSVNRICVDFDSLISKDHIAVLKRLSSNSASVTDGKGVQRVLNQLEQSNE